jgi:C1A family cysteine protease
MAVGYDDKDKRSIVRNSWGEKWGMKGYFTMPYAFVADRDLPDFWTIRRVRRCRERGGKQWSISRW